MNRFNCRLTLKKDRPIPVISDRNGIFMFNNGAMKLGISRKTGLIEYYSVGKINYISARAFEPTVIVDNEDPWGMKVKRFDEIDGVFKLSSPSECARFCGIRKKTLAPVRVIEDGEVRTVVCLLYTSPSPRDGLLSRMPSSA